MMVTSGRYGAEVTMGQNLCGGQRYIKHYW